MTFRLRRYFVNLINFKTFNWFDILLIVSIVAISIISSVVTGKFDTLGSIVAFCGVICVVLGAKGSIGNWIFGIIGSVLYAYICFRSHIYGDALQRAFFNLPMQFLGWYWWQSRRRDDESSLIRTRFMSWQRRFYWVLTIVFFTFCFGWFLHSFGSLIYEFLSKWIGMESAQADYSNISQLYMDSFTTVMMIVATFISTRGYVEQWLLWILINFFSIFIWIQNLGQPDSNAIMMIGKYSLYLINSFYGFWMWRKLSK